jgi:hypothetical protein
MSVTDHSAPAAQPAATTNPARAQAAAEAEQAASLAAMHATMR